MKIRNLWLLLAITAGTFACGNTAETQQADNEETVTSATEEPATEEPAEWEIEHQLFMPGYADSVNQGLIAEDTFKGSSRREVTQEIAGTDVTVNYGSPGKRGRVLWNGLVSYDQVWVSGSHWATAVTFQNNVKVGETVVPAGKYAFFTIPGREQWELIINKNFDQHLADEYDEAEDVVRMTVDPEEPSDVVQRLTYEVEDMGEGKGAITMAWDQVKVAMPFEVVQ